MSEVELHNQNNVYILGAGFSTMAGIPPVQGFLNATRDAYVWLQQDNSLKGELEAVRNLLAFRQDCAAAAYRSRLDIENIEDLFSLAAADGGAGTTDLRLAISATIRFCLAQSKQSAVRIISQRSLLQGASIPISWRAAHQVEDHHSEHRPMYEALVGMMAGFLTEPVGGTDTIVSFNYDLLVEQGARGLSLGVDYGLPLGSVVYREPAALGPRNATDVKLLKLHGSMNWCTPDRDEAIGVYESYENLLSAGGTPYLVPPTWQKTLSDAGAHVWNAALQALGRATRIFVIGFSLPPTDLHFKYLLAAGLRRNNSLREIVVVNPDESVRERCLAILREDLVGAGVLQFTRGHRQVAQNFLIDPDSIGRQLRAGFQVDKSFYPSQG